MFCIKTESGDYLCQIYTYGYDYSEYKEYTELVFETCDLAQEFIDNLPKWFDDTLYIVEE